MARSLHQSVFAPVQKQTVFNESIDYEAKEALQIMKPRTEDDLAADEELDLDE